MQINPSAMYPRRPGHQAEAREGGALITLSDGGDAATDATRSLRGAAEREEEVRSARCASRGCTAKEREHAMESRTSARGRMMRVGRRSATVLRAPCWQRPAGVNAVTRPRPEAVSLFSLTPYLTCPLLLLSSASAPAPPDLDFFFCSSSRNSPKSTAPLLSRSATLKSFCTRSWLW